MMILIVTIIIFNYNLAINLVPDLRLCIFKQIIRDRKKLPLVYQYLKEATNYVPQRKPIQHRNTSVFHLNLQKD